MLKDVICDEKGLSKLEARDHVCLVYGSEQEWSSTVPLFIEDGIDRSEKCVYICNTHQPDFIRRAIMARGIDAGYLESGGQLVIYVFQDFLKNLELDIYDMINFLYRVTQKAIAEGYTGMRLVMEMKEFPHIVNAEQILKFETRLNRYLFNRFPCLAMCLYDKQVNDPHFIKDAILAHPLIVQGEHVFPNTHYVGPSKVVHTQKGSNAVDSFLEVIEQQGIKNERLHFFNDVLNECLQPFCSMYADGSIMLCNEAFCSLTGYNREEIYQKVRFADFIRLESIDQHFDALRKIKASGEAQRYETEIYLKNGNCLEVEVLLHQLQERNYQNKYYYLFLNDVSERKATTWLTGS